MRRLQVLVVLIFSVSCCYAQVKATAKGNPNAAQSSAKVPPNPALPRVPTGPSGFGALKIGMTKESIESLGESDGFYLAGPMTPHVSRFASPVGIDQFDAQLKTPLSSKSLEAILSFQGSELKSFYVSFYAAPSAFDVVSQQIAEKYGAGKETNNRKEEQCIYKNGNSFKLADGKISTNWSDEISQTERIDTTLSDYLSQNCPADLSSSTTNKIQIKSLTIDKIRRAANVAKPNMF